MNFKDYYKILGLDKKASAAEIKKAYRKLAIKYHPDKNQGDKAAEERFKEINEANEVLGDPEKRKKYDELGENWQHYQQGQQHSGAGGFDWSKWTTQPGNGQRYYTYSSDRQQFDESQFSDFFEQLFGSQRSRKVPQAGADYQAELSISLEDAYKGGKHQVDINGEKLQLHLKPGLADKQLLRLKGKGGPGRNGGPSGDLYLSIFIKPHSHFERKGNDIYASVPVDLYSMLLGGKALVHTLEGYVKIDIPAGTENGKVLRLKNKGMPVYGKENEYGNFYAKVEVVLPHTLSEHERNLIMQLRDLQGRHESKAA